MHKLLPFSLLLFYFSLVKSQNAPDFTFTDTDGISWNLYSELNNGKTVLLDFFYVSCIPCQTYTPEIIQVNNDYGSGNGRLRVFGISDRDDNISIKDFDQSLGVNYPSCGTDGGGNNITDLYISWFPFVGWPTYAVVCPDKTIAWNLPKSDGLTEIREAIESCPDLTGIIKSSRQKNYWVYPLPAREHVLIKSEEANSAKISLYDMKGTYKYSSSFFDLSNGAINIPLDGLDSGFYLLKIETSDEQTVIKIPVIK